MHGLGGPIVDRVALATEAHLDGKFLLRTDDENLPAKDIARGYKSALGNRAKVAGQEVVDSRHPPRPPPTRGPHPRRGPAVRTGSAAVARRRDLSVGDIWRNIRNEPNRMHLVMMATSQGTGSQQSEPTPRHRHTLGALGLADSPRSSDFTPASDEEPAPAS